MSRRLGGIQSKSGRLGEETYSFPLSGIEQIFLSRPAIFVVSNPNELNRLLHFMWIMDKCRGALIGRETVGGRLNWRYKFTFNLKNYIIKLCYKYSCEITFPLQMHLRIKNVNTSIKKVVRPKTIRQTCSRIQWYKETGNL